MGERRSYPITWGGGLDRGTGIGVANPSDFSDLRNVLLYEGRAAARAGMSSLGGLVDDLAADATDVLAIAPFRWNESVVLVGWNSATRVVSIYEAASNGMNPVHVATWFTAGAGIGIPRFSLAESYGRMFLAHEYQLVKPGVPYLRAVTKVYDGTSVTTLTADLDRSSSAEDLRFRALGKYLNYLIGIGYGTGADEDRPEIVRVSKPADPTTWIPEHYFLVGQREDPAVCGIPGPRSFLIFKESETYEIFGHGVHTFGQRGPIDAFHGALGHNLAIYWGGAVWFWSHDGPRMTQGGGPSQALDRPLDIPSPAPSTLVEEGDPAHAFVVYNPTERTIEWHFPTEAVDITRVYVQHVRDRMKWSYTERKRRVRCGATLFPVSQTAPPGFPDIDTIDNITSAGFRLTWTNTSALGDEVTEVWLKNTTDAGPWTKVIEYDYESATMVKTLNDVLEPGDDFSISLRHRRGALYNSGAENTGDPSGWPAASRDTFTAAAIGAAPTFFELHATMGEFYGGKGYTRHQVQWEKPVGFPKGWEIWENTVNDFGTATVAAHGKNHDVGDTDSGLVSGVTCDTPGCVTTDQLVKLTDPPPLQDYYYWVVYVEGGTYTPGVGFGGTGARSVEQALAENPINYASAL